MLVFANMNPVIQPFGQPWNRVRITIYQCEPWHMHIPGKLGIKSGTLLKRIQYEVSLLAMEKWPPISDVQTSCGGQWGLYIYYLVPIGPSLQILPHKKWVNRGLYLSLKPGSLQDGRPPKMLLKSLSIKQDPFPSTLTDAQISFMATLSNQEAH